MEEVRRARHGFTSIKSNAIKAAKDFHYSKEVIKKLNAAETTDEINIIMRSARHEKFEQVKSKNYTYKPSEEKLDETVVNDISEETDDGVETYKCSEVMKNCVYSKRFNNVESRRYCNYLCMKKERRGCPAEKCTKYKPITGNEDPLVRLKL